MPSSGRAGRTSGAIRGIHLKRYCTIPRQAKLLEYIDVLVDGKFKEELRDEDLYFRGSSNQRLIDVPASLKAKKAVDYVYNPKL